MNRETRNRWIAAIIAFAISIVSLFVIVSQSPNQRQVPERMDIPMGVRSLSKSLPGFIPGIYPQYSGNPDYYSQNNNWWPVGDRIYHGWSEINPTEGTFDLSPYTNDFNRSAAWTTKIYDNNNTTTVISVPVIIMLPRVAADIDGDGSPDDWTPSWVYNAGSAYDVLDGQRVGYALESGSCSGAMPRYDDSTWQSKYIAAVNAVVEQFATDDRVAGFIIPAGFDDETQPVRSLGGCNYPSIMRSRVGSNLDTYKFIDYIVEVAKNVRARTNKSIWVQACTAPGSAFGTPSAPFSRYHMFKLLNSVNGLNVGFKSNCLWPDDEGAEQAFKSDWDGDGVKEPHLGWGKYSTASTLYDDTYSFGGTPLSGFEPAVSNYTNADNLIPWMIYAAIAYDGSFIDLQKDWIPRIPSDIWDLMRRTIGRGPSESDDAWIVFRDKDTYFVETTRGGTCTYDVSSYNSSCAAGNFTKFITVTNPSSMSLMQDDTDSEIWIWRRANSTVQFDVNDSYRYDGAVPNADGGNIGYDVRIKYKDTTAGTFYFEYQGYSGGVCDGTTVQHAITTSGSGGWVEASFTVNDMYIKNCFGTAIDFRINPNGMNLDLHRVWIHGYFLSGAPTATNTSTSTPVIGYTPTPVPGATTTQLVISGTTYIEDTWLNGSASTTNYGAGTYLKIYQSDIANVVIKFDISSIPSDATITSAKIRLQTTVDGEAGETQTIQIHRLLVPFTETEATWNIRQTGVDWNTPGGLGDDSDIASVSYGTIVVTNTLSTFDSTDITTLVEEWRDGTYTNNGVLLRAPTGSSTWYNFYSTEAGASSGPQLIIEYTTQTPHIAGKVLFDDGSIPPTPAATPDWGLGLDKRDASSSWTPVATVQPDQYGDWSASTSITETWRIVITPRANWGVVAPPTPLVDCAVYVSDAEVLFNGSDIYCDDIQLRVVEFTATPQTVVESTPTAGFVGGYIFVDLTPDLTRYSSEPGIGDAHVHFDKLDGTPVATAISVGSGWYDIELENESYNVALTPPSGYVITSTSPVSITITPGGWEYVNFALQKATVTPVLTPTAGFLGGYAFKDTNGDLVRQDTESGIPDIGIGIENTSLTPMATGTTNSSGYYQFELDNDTYRIVVTPHTDWVLTSSSPVTVVVTPGEVRYTDFAFVTPTPIPDSAPTSTPTAGFVAGKTFKDKNYDGLYGDADDVLPYVPLIIKDLSDVVISQPTTDAQGEYVVELQNGSYKIYATPPAEYVLSSSSPVTFTVTPGGTRTINFGFITVTPTYTPVAGATNTPTPTPTLEPGYTYINEYLHEPDCTQDQNFNNDFVCNNGDAYVEFRTTNTSQQSIDGWYIKINATKWFTMPTGAILPANGRKVIFNSDTGNTTSSLDYTGVISLYTSSDVLVDSVTLLGVDTQGAAQGRPGDVRTDTWSWISSPSPGRYNPWK